MGYVFFGKDISKQTVGKGDGKMKDCFDKFQDQIKARLEYLTLRDTRYFAWLWAVRGLPFLGARGNFDYWKKANGYDERQKHLLGVLNDLDIVAIQTGTTSSASDDASRAANSPLGTTTGSVLRAEHAAHAVASAVDAAVTVASTGDTGMACRMAAFLTTLLIDNISNAVDAAGYASPDDIAYKISSNFNTLLVNDLNMINAGRRNFQSDTAIYGKIWGNFQNALRGVDCGYWGDWYARLFANGFILEDDDYREIEKRLNVPDEIAKQGAAGVANYMSPRRRWWQ